MSPERELTPDEIVADIEAMKGRRYKGGGPKVTIYQSWPRMILERERAAAESQREALDVERLARAIPRAYSPRPTNWEDEGEDMQRLWRSKARRIAAEYAALKEQPR